MLKKKVGELYEEKMSIYNDTDYNYACFYRKRKCD